MHSGMTLVRTEVGNGQCITSLPNVYKNFPKLVLMKLVPVKMGNREKKFLQSNTINQLLYQQTIH